MPSSHSMSCASLPPASGGTAKQLVMFLHGVGADGNDLIGLAPEFSDILPDAAFDSPNAPFPCDMAPIGRQWFSLQTRDPHDMLQGLEHVAPLLNSYIDDALATHKLTDEQLIIIGFSQGTMTALHTMLRRPAPCAALIGFSGALIPADSAITAKPPICLIHGRHDDVVPFAAMGAAASYLSDNGIAVETHPQAGLGHSINMEGVAAARNAISRVI